MKTSSTTEQKIKNLEQRIKELRVLQKKEVAPGEVTRIMNEILKLQARIRELKSNSNN
jgi:hypothetical protein